MHTTYVHSIHIKRESIHKVLLLPQPTGMYNVVDSYHNVNKCVFTFKTTCDDFTGAQDIIPVLMANIHYVIRSVF